MTTPSVDSVLQIKIRLLNISPMIWRRVRIPENYTLHQLHGVIQTAMGWEGIHLFEFRIRAVEYTPFYLQGESPDISLAQFHFRKNTKFIYAYDMGDYWQHEVRIFICRIESAETVVIPGTGNQKGLSEYDRICGYGLSSPRILVLPVPRRHVVIPNSIPCCF